jgi:hypothetical protein
MKLGIVACGVLRKTLNEYSVTERSAAMAAKLGALGLIDDWVA